MLNEVKMKKGSRIFSVVMLMVIVLISLPSLAQMNIKTSKSTSGTNAAVLKTDMRKLWEDHIIWTRNVIFCLVDDLPGTDPTVRRLLQNQDDIGDAIKVYYGEEAGKTLTDLLYSHVLIAVEMVKVAKEENAIALDEVNNRWKANSNEIAKFLCNANPNWILTEMKTMMADHLKLTTDQVVQRIKKNYDADIVAYDRVHDEILKMADMLSEGIIKQFPEKFITITNKKLASE